MCMREEEEAESGEMVAWKEPEAILRGEPFVPRPIASPRTPDTLTVSCQNSRSTRKHVTCSQSLTKTFEKLFRYHSLYSDFLQATYTRCVIRISQPLLSTLRDMLRTILARSTWTVARSSRFTATPRPIQRFVRFESNSPYKSETPEETARREHKNDMQRDWDAPKLTYEQVKSKTLSPSPVSLAFVFRTYRLYNILDPLYRTRI